VKKVQPGPPKERKVKTNDEKESGTIKKEKSRIQEKIKGKKNKKELAGSQRPIWRPMGKKGLA